MKKIVLLVTICFFIISFSFCMEQEELPEGMEELLRAERECNLSKYLRMLTIHNLTPNTPDENGQGTISRLLMNYGAGEFYKDHFFCKKIYFEAIKHLAADITLQDKNGETPLHIACKLRKGYRPVYSVLPALILPELLELRNKDGLNPLHLMVMNENPVFGRLPVLLKEARKINLPTPAGDTILHLAVKKDCIRDALTIFDNNNIDINAQNFKGETALHCLASKKRPDVDYVLNKLLDKNANPMIRNEDGETPIDILYKRRWHKGIRIFESRKDEPFWDGSEDVVKLRQRYEGLCPSITHENKKICSALEKAIDQQIDEEISSRIFEFNTEGVH